MKKLPSIKQLRYFVALEKHGHFGQAAEACFVSQPAFSVAIRELESLLGVQLVDRNQRQVTVTALGREIAAQARECLHAAEELVDIARRQEGLLQGDLRLGVIPTIAPFLLPPVLPELRTTFPELRLFLREEQTEDLLALLREGELDAGIIALPWELPGLNSVTLFADSFLLAARSDTVHMDPEQYRPADVDPGSVLLLGDGHCLRDHAISACQLRDSAKISGFTASSLLTLVEMVDADLGITFLPQMATTSKILDGTDVHTWPLADASYRDIGLVWRKGSGRGEEFALLGEQITQSWQEAN